MVHKFHTILNRRQRIYTQRRKCEGSSPDSLRPTSYFGSIWQNVCFGPKNQSFFVGKRTSYIFPWTRDSQCQNRANTLAKNTRNASKNVSPICLPKPKSFEFFKRSSLWESVVRVPCDTHTDRNFVVEFDA